MLKYAMTYLLKRKDPPRPGSVSLPKVAFGSTEAEREVTFYTAAELVNTSFFLSMNDPICKRHRHTLFGKSAAFHIATYDLDCFCSLTKILSTLE